MIDWGTIGQGIMAVVVGALGWIAGRQKRKTEAVEEGAERDVIRLLRDELDRLSARVSAMEKREGRLIRHVYRLEGLMRGAGMEPPAFEIDGLPIKAGGTD